VFGCLFARGKPIELEQPAADEPATLAGPLAALHFEYEDDYGDTHLAWRIVDLRDESYGINRP